MDHHYIYNRIINISELQITIFLDRIVYAYTYTETNRE